jgi:hypothetical protein
MNEKQIEQCLDDIEMVTFEVSNLFALLSMKGYPMHSIMSGAAAAISKLMAAMVVAGMPEQTAVKAIGHLHSPTLETYTRMLTAMRNDKLANPQGSA